ncbi:MAG: TfoX/Sxy family protein [Abditibacteriota bacterium]|nr:TfoX/Sxy family protein [Abditibacteriota bacterium]
MSSSREYVEYVLDQLSGLGDVSCRQMMGEYVIYLRGKVIGGVYDDRFLLKATPSAERLMPLAARELPYPGAREMLLADCLDDRETLERVAEAVYEELPPSKKR